MLLNGVAQQTRSKDKDKRRHTSLAPARSMQRPERDDDSSRTTIHRQMTDNMTGNPNDGKGKERYASGYASSWQAGCNPTRITTDSRKLAWQVDCRQKPTNTTDNKTDIMTKIPTDGETTGRAYGHPRSNGHPHTSPKAGVARG